MKAKWNGVYPAITTMFNEDGTLDLNTFEKNISIQIDAGIHGIVLGGTLGEASTLKNDEKLQLIEKTLEVGNGKLPVVINIAEQTTKDAVKAACEAENNGASGLMLLPPMRYRADSDETISFFKSVAGSTDLPIMIYNNPIDYGIEVTLDMFEELIEFENIQAVKESTRDVTNITRMINRFGDRIDIMCGVDTIALESLLLGATGWVAGLVCAFPHETVAIYNLVKARQIDDALKLYRWFMPLLELDIHTKLVQYIKLAEVATGTGTEFVRKPRLPLAGEERERILNIINDTLDRRDEILHLVCNNEKIT